MTVGTMRAQNPNLEKEHILGEKERERERDQVLPIGDLAGQPYTIPTVQRYRPPNR